MSAPAICPCCGYDLARSQPIELGDWRLDVQGNVALRSAAVPLSQQQAQFLFTLAKAHPRIVPHDAMIARISVGEVESNILPVIVHRLRKMLGDECPIETVRDAGYRWRTPVSAEREAVAA